MRAQCKQSVGQCRVGDKDGEAGVIKDTGCDEQAVLLRQAGRDIGDAACKSDKAA